MQYEAHRDPLPQDYSGWEEDFPEAAVEETKSPRWTSRSVFKEIAVFTLALGLGYYFGTKNSLENSATGAMSPPPSVNQSFQSELARSSREIEILKTAVSEQNGMNQQMAITIGALQSEQHHLREQISAMQTRFVPNQKTVATTGSINTPARTRAGSKQSQQAPLNTTPTRP